MSYLEHLHVIARVVQLVLEPLSVQVLVVHVPVLQSVNTGQQRSVNTGQQRYCTLNTGGTTKVWDHSTILVLCAVQVLVVHVPVLQFSRPSSPVCEHRTTTLFSDAGKTTKICEQNTVLEPLAMKALVVHVHLLQLVSTGQQQNSRGLVARVQHKRIEVNARCCNITDHAGSRCSRVAVVAINIIIDRFYIALFSAFEQTHSRISIQN